MIKRRGGEKGHSLAYWFEQTMEFGDASDEEAPLLTQRRERCQNVYGCRWSQCSKGWKATAT